jgi:hypothetical protein
VPDESLSDERLSEIEFRCHALGPGTPCPADALALLAEVRRLRAVERELRGHVRALVGRVESLAGRAEGGDNG